MHSGSANCIDDRSGFRYVSSAANNSLGHNFRGSVSILNVANCAAFECIPLPINVSPCLLRPSVVILAQLFHSASITPLTTTTYACFVPQGSRPEVFHSNATVETRRAGMVAFSWSNRLLPRIYIRRVTLALIVTSFTHLQGCNPTKAHSFDFYSPKLPSVTSLISRPVISSLDATPRSLHQDAIHKVSSAAGSPCLHLPCPP